jgi:hypothetical protein
MGRRLLSGWTGHRRDRGRERARARLSALFRRPLSRSGDTRRPVPDPEGGVLSIKGAHIPCGFQGILRLTFQRTIDPEKRGRFLAAHTMNKNSVTNARIQIHVFQSRPAPRQNEEPNRTDKPAYLRSNNLGPTRCSIPPAFSPDQLMSASNAVRRRPSIGIGRRVVRST